MQDKDNTEKSRELMYLIFVNRKPGSSINKYMSLIMYHNKLNSFSRIKVIEGQKEKKIFIPNGYQVQFSSGSFPLHV